MGIAGPYLVASNVQKEAYAVVPAAGAFVFFLWRGGCVRKQVIFWERFVLGFRSECARRHEGTDETNRRTQTRWCRPEPSAAAEPAATPSSIKHTTRASHSKRFARPHRTAGRA